MQSLLALSAVGARTVARTALATHAAPSQRALSVLGNRSRMAAGAAAGGAEQRRRMLDAAETSVRARLEQGTSLLRMRNTAKARDIFCALVNELEAQRVAAGTPRTADMRLLAAAYAGRARAFIPATPATYVQVLRDFDTAMRLDPAWVPVLTSERRLCEALHGSKTSGQLYGLHFLPVSF